MIPPALPVPAECSALFIRSHSRRSPAPYERKTLELTHDMNALPALLVASVVSYGFTVLVMKRSILTEKVARRAYHVSREYSVDPLELAAVGDIMTTPVVTVPASCPSRSWWPTTS